MNTMLSLIVLAAGKSTRMRGRNKLLAQIHGKPMIRKVVETALNSKADEVIVVLGWEAEKLRAVLHDLPCHLIMNRDYEQGQSSSVKAGLRAIGNATRAIIVLPADIAKIDTSSINLVIDEYNQTEAPLIIAAYKGNLGHPILLSKELFKEIEQIGEPTFGLKSIMKKHKSEMRLVETGRENVLRDVDTPEDLKELLNA